MQLGPNRTKGVIFGVDIAQSSVALVRVPLSPDELRRSPNKLFVRWLRDGIDAGGDVLIGDLQPVATAARHFDSVCSKDTEKTSKCPENGPFTEITHSKTTKSGKRKKEDVQRPTRSFKSPR